MTHLHTLFGIILALLMYITYLNKTMRPILFILLLSLTQMVSAQSDGKATNSKAAGSIPAKPALDDCPDFKKPKKNSRADYYEYMRNNRGKKPVQQTTQDTPAATPVTTDQNTSTATSDVDRKEQQKKDFYATSKYNRTQTTNKAEQKPPVTAATTQPVTPVVTPAQEPAAPVANADNNSTVVVKEQPQQEAMEQKDESQQTQATANTSEKSDAALAAQHVKEKPNKAEKKMRRLLTKKNNKRAKPNYKKCTSF